MIDAPVTDLMTSPIRTIDRETTATDAARELTEQGIEFASTPVSALMSDPVVAIAPGESVRAAGERMGRNNVKKLPVAENGEAIGIVTTTDLARFFPENAVRMSHQPEPDIEKGGFE